MFLIDKNTLEHKSGNQGDYCKKCFVNNDKCKAFYSKLKDSEPLSIHECPFGYCAVSSLFTIFTGIKLKGLYSSKKVESNARGKDSSSIVDKEDLMAVLKDICNLENEVLNKNIYVQTIHDIKRASSSFSDKLDEVIQEGKYKEDPVLRDLLDGFDFIGTRLDYHDFSLGKQNNLALGAYRVNLVKIGVKLSKMLKYRSEPKQVKIINNSDGCSNIHIIADSKIIYVLFFVLVDNAIKYSPINEIIHIDYSDYDNDKILVAFNNKVSTPLSEDDVINLFRPGFRGSNSLNETGTGVGMSIVKNIIDIYNLDYLLPEPNSSDYSFGIIFRKKNNGNS